MRNISAEDTNFKHADLRGADLSHAVMGGASLRSSNVAGTNFKGVELATVNMEFANFSQALNADIPSYKTNLR